MSWREFLLVLHIAGAGAWLGANIVQAIVPRITVQDGPAAAAAWFRTAARLSSRLYMPAAILILLTGILLVIDNEAYGFGTLFVTIGFAMIVIGAVLGILVFDPGSKAAAEAIESGDESRIRAAVSRLAAFGALDTVLLVLTIAAMVTRWS